MIDEAAVRKIVEELGGLKKMWEEGDRFEALWQSLQARKEELTKQYPNKWIALYGDKIVVASTHEELLVREDEAGFRRGHTVVDYLSTEPEIWVL